MSAPPPTRSVQQRISGKWQVPLLVLSVVIFVVAMLVMRPTPEPPSIAECVDQIRSLKTGLLLPEAEQLARMVLGDEARERQTLGPVYAELAEIQFRIQKNLRSRDAGKLISALANYEQAERLGHALSGEAHAQRAEIYEWLKQPTAALDRYRAALQFQPGDPLEIRRRILALQLQSIDTPRAALHAGFDALILDCRSRPEILQWVVTQKVEMLLEEGRHPAGQKVVNDNAAYLQGTPFEQHIQYLTAWLAYRGGHHDQAELILRHMRSLLPTRGQLHAQSGWLLGKVVLMDEGPQRPLEAITFFRDVLDAHPTGTYVTACKLGMAEALSDLQRFGEALAYFRAALADLADLPATPLIDRRTISSALVVRSKLLQEEARHDQALDYLQLAVDLIDLSDPASLVVYMQDLVMLKERVANHKREAAAAALAAGNQERAAALGAKSRELFLSTAQDYLRLSDVQHHDENASADALWRAASMFDAAGKRGETIRLLDDFIRNRPQNANIPMALFKLGQAYQAEGQLLKAVQQYQTCVAEYRQTRPTQMALIPLADCFVMLGPDYAPQAEETLLYILDPGPGQPFMFTPQSGIYRRALFKLGVVYSRNGRYEEAIYRLNEALERYPQDPHAARATFLLADAYRHSGLDVEALARDMTNALRREEMFAKKRARLEKAQHLFGEVIQRLSDKPRGELTVMESRQRMLSYMYRADCAFDLGNYERAHALYEEVVQNYQENPVTLSAYIQIISCLEKSGRVAEIGPALERASYLTDKIDAQEYQASLIHRDQSGWKNIFDWMASTQKYR